MSKTKATAIIDAAVTAGYVADMHVDPAYLDTSSGTETAVARNYTVRLSSRTGTQLGSDLLAMINAQAVNLASTDILVV